MGLCVFLLICGPATALLYFPLTTRKQGFHLTPAVVSQTPAGSTPAHKRLQHNRLDPYSGSAVSPMEERSLRNNRLTG